MKDYCIFVILVCLEQKCIPELFFVSPVIYWPIVPGKHGHGWLVLAATVLKSSIDMNSDSGRGERKI